MEVAYPYGRRRTLILMAGIIAGALAAGLSQTIVATAVPKIVGDFGAISDYSWIFTMYLLGATVTVPLFGRLSDIYGRRPLFALAILFFVAGCVICGLAQSMPLLIGGRTIQGIGAGGIVPISMAITGDLISPRRRGTWQAFTGVLLGLGFIVGPTLGGAIVDNANWRWVFFVTIPLAVVSLAVIWAYAETGTPSRHSVDYLGAVLLTATALAGLLGIIWGGNEFPWASWQIVALFLATAVLCAVFVAWERRTDAPILPLELFRDRTVVGAFVCTACYGAALTTVPTYTPLFVQGVLGSSATSSGAVVTPLMCALFLTNIISGQVTSRTGRYKEIVIVGPLIIAAGFVLLARLDAASSSWDVTVAVAVVGAGLGFGISTLVVIVQNIAPTPVMGAAVSAGHFCRQIGGAVGIAAMGAILASRLPVELGARIPPAEQARLGISPDAILNQAVADLPGRTLDAVHAALAAAMHPMFVSGIALGGIGLAAAMLLERRELRGTVHPVAESGE